jgi:hypothetical protein
MSTMHHISRAGLMSVVAGVLLCAVASAQLSDPLQNPSFELAWNEATPPRSPNARPGGVFGFTNNNDTAAQRRVIGDGLSPTAVARTGTKSISLGSVPFGNFYGYTTDTLDSMPPNFTFLYYDLPISWLEGDLEWSVWYNIPASTPLAALPPEPWPSTAGPFAWPANFAPFSMKIDVKGAGNGFQNNASKDGWDLAAKKQIEARSLLIGGTTNGQWQQFSVRWPARTSDGKGWKDAVEAISTDPVFGFSLPSPGTWPNPPIGQVRWPDRAKVTFGRWFPELFGGPGGQATGTIFLDDWTFRQLPAGPALCGPADIGGEGGAEGGDGTLDNNDFIVYIGYFFAADPRADVGSEGGAEGPDGSFDNNDFIVFISQFFAGC